VRFAFPEDDKTHAIPVLREHAIFTLQALLKDNTENKAFVDSIRPNAEFDDSGILKDKFGALRI
jgi:ataxin-10